MRGMTTNQTKHADGFTSDTPVWAASIPPVFPFDRTVVPINWVNDSVFSASGTIIRAASAIIVILQRTISLPHTIIDATPAIIFASQIIVSEAQITISAMETVIS